MSRVDVQQLRTQRAILDELRAVRELVTRGVRYLATIAGELERADGPVSFRVTVEDGPER